MATEYNKGRAAQLLSQLNGRKSHGEGIVIFASILSFLLNRYINED